MVYQELIVAAMCAALFAGFCVGATLVQAQIRKRYKTLIKQRIGLASLLQRNQLSVGASSIAAALLGYAARCTYEARFLDSRLEGLVRLWSLNRKKAQELLMQCGLWGVIDERGLALARLKLTVACCFAGGCLGLLLSDLLGILLALVGLLFGLFSLPWALRQERNERVFVVEKELSQMIEVLVLGLRSGLSFDRSFEFYHQYFEGTLSRGAASVQNQWTHGLLTKTEGLRVLAQAYDSSLLSRSVESIIRSLRYGTSLTESLSVTGEEARSIRKAKLEERVAKAPVKMLLPVGGLILPAMLILVMGPILLELMQGF